MKPKELVMSIDKFMEKLALDLFDIGAVKDKHQSPDGKGFRLKLHETNTNAPLSPIFMNLRTADNSKPGPLTAEIVNEIAFQLYAITLYKVITYNAVAGIPNAGDPFAEKFSLHAGRRLWYLDKKTENGKRRICGIKTGNYTKGDKILLIDDLITEADSKIEAVRALRDQDLIVDTIIVLVDREQGGKEELKRYAVNLYSVFTLRELLDIYLKTGRMDGKACDEVKEYLAQNK